MIQSKGGRVAWAASIFYLLFICLAPLLSPANAAENETENYGTVIGIDLGTTYSYALLFNFSLSLAVE
jgi:heat shock protein 5